MASAARDPRIVAIVCSWHPLTAADNAGMDRQSVGALTDVVPVDCAGIVSVASILRAFSNRADGVFVAACGEGDCHCVNGNESCEKVVAEARELMSLAGLNPERLRLDLSSDVDGGRFAALLAEFASDLSRLNGGARKRAGAGRRRVAAKKPPAKKAPAKKATGKKAAAKKAPGKKLARKKKAGKKTAVAKGTSKRAAVRKSAGKGTTAKKATGKKAAAKKATGKKAAAKRATGKKRAKRSSGGR